MRDPAYGKAAEIFQSIGPALKNLWLPRLQLALAEAAMEGHREPVPLGNSIISLTWPFSLRGWRGDGWLTGCCSRSSAC